MFSLITNIAEYFFTWTSRLRLAATSYVMKDITGPGDNGGFPAVHLHEWRRQLDKLQITVGHTKSGT
ncbi:hypothetical protein FF1_005132 [Malus domestica]